MSLLAADDMTVPEWRLCEAAAVGELLDLQTGRPEDDDPGRGWAWGAGRQIRAQLLYQLLTGWGELDAKFGPAVAVRLQGAAVLDPLRLSLLTLRCPLQLQACYLDGTLDLTKTHGPDVDLQGSHLNRLAAVGLSVTHDLTLRGCTCDHGVALEGAHVGGILACSGAKLTNPSGAALSGDGLTVDGDVLLDDGFTATGAGGTGAVRLPGAHIGGPLNCRGAKLTNQTAVVRRTCSRGEVQRVIASVDVAEAR
jgi:hypothetical protein